MVRECEKCGNEVKKDDRGRFVCTVCNFVSQAASVAISEYDEALLVNRGVGGEKTRRSRIEEKEAATERDYFICYQQALQTQTMYLIHNYDFSPLVIDALRVIWFKYLEEQENSGIRFQRKLVRGVKRVKPHYFASSLSNKVVEDWNSTEQKWNAFAPPKPRVPQVFPLNIIVDDEEEEEEEEGEENGEARKIQLIEWEELRENIGLDDRYFLEEEKTVTKPLNMSEFRRLMKMSLESHRFGKELVIRKQDREKAKEYKRKAEAAKGKTVSVAFEESSSSEESSGSWETDTDASSESSEGSKSSTTQNSKSKENSDEEMPDSASTQGGDNKMEIDAETEAERTQKQLKEALRQYDPKLYNPAAILELSRNFKETEETYPVDEGALEYRVKLASHAKRFGLHGGFDKNGLPRFKHTLGFMLLAIYMVGEVLLPCDLVRWIENMDFPYFEFGIVYKQFNPYENHFVVNGLPLAKNIYNAAGYLATLLKIDKIPKINYPLVLRSMFGRFNVPEVLLPMCIELASSMNWDFYVNSRAVSVDIRSAVVILLLCKFLYPVVPPKNLDEMVRAPPMELTQEEASVLFYIQNLPSFEEWMKAYKGIYATRMNDPEECFKEFYKQADHEVRSRTIARKNAATISGLLKEVGQSNGLRVNPEAFIPDSPVDNTNWELSDLYKLHGPSTFPVYRYGHGEYHEALNSMIYRFAATLKTNPKNLSNQLSKFENKIMKLVKSFSPEPKIPISVYSSSILASK